MIRVSFSHNVDELMDWLLDWTSCEIRDYESGGGGTARRMLMETMIDTCKVCVEMFPKWQTTYDLLIAYKEKATMGRSLMRITNITREHMAQFQINDFPPSAELYSLDTLQFAKHYINERNKELTESHTRCMVDSKEWELPLRKLEDTKEFWMFAQRFVDYTCWYHNAERLLAYWPLHDPSTHEPFKTFVSENAVHFNVLAKITYSFLPLYEWAVMEWCKHKRWLKMRMIIYSMDCLKILHRGFVEKFGKDNAYFVYRVLEHSIILCNEQQVKDYLQPLTHKKVKV